MQTLRNALSPYKLGGAAGGSDFDPKGKSDNEVLSILIYQFLNLAFLRDSGLLQLLFTKPEFADHALLPEFYE